MESLSLGIAFGAGLLSFLSPCVLPLIPSYVTFITGLSLEDLTRARRAALLHGALFVVGFSAIFLALGASASLLGQLLLQQRDIINRVGGVVVVLFGLYLLGVFDIGFLTRERRLHLANRPWGYVGSVFVGVAFGAGWTPCLGPILGSILIYTSSQADLGRGMALLSAYSAGLAVPFLAAALAVERFVVLLQKVRRYLVWVSRVAGVLMIGVGILMLTNYFTILASYLQSLTPEVLKSRL
ncbi:MAG TPA: cytochrome c biogenesis protein CcdA [Gemmatimonadaceae bacterium]|jgi:cytochrome c-type biogenesis protein|nr:cytochrome c biogenesis protein CcdA [Gemmatimonadaceae bacterium]